MINQYTEINITLPNHHPNLEEKTPYIINTTNSSNLRWSKGMKFKLWIQNEINLVEKQYPNFRHKKIANLTNLFEEGNICEKKMPEVNKSEEIDFESSVLKSVEIT